MNVSPWRFPWSGSIGNGAIWTPKSPRKKKSARRKAILGRIKSALGPRAWSAPSPAPGVRTVGLCCNLDSIPTASACVAGSISTVANNAPILIPARGSNACSLSPNASPAKTRKMTAHSTSSERRSKRIRRHRRRRQHRRFPPSVSRVPTTPGKHSTIFSRSKNGHNPVAEHSFESGGGGAVPGKPDIREWRERVPSSVVVLAPRVWIPRKEPGASLLSFWFMQGWSWI
jgi:hypothetical protein